MSLHSTALPLGTASAVVLLVLAATAPTAVAASTDTRDEAATADRLDALLPPQGSAPDDAHGAADAGDLVPTDAVAPNGTVVFRLNGIAATGAASNRSLGGGVTFRMHQTDRTTTPERLPVRLNTSASGDAVRTFAADGDRYVVVDLADAVWEYDAEPGTHALDPQPRVGQGYEATLTVTANGTTVAGNTTVRVTEPSLAGDAETAAGGTARLTVSLPGRWTATLVVGNESVGYRTALQVVDEDADGQVVVRFDTAAADTDDAFTAVGPDSVEPHPEATEFALGNGTLTPGEYPLVAGASLPATLSEVHRGWDPVLSIGEATPTAPATATATPRATATSTAPATGTPPGTLPRTTTESPGFGGVTVLLVVAAVGAVLARSD